MDEPARLTAYFPYWQGLRWVVVGAGTMIAAIAAGGAVTTPVGIGAILAAATIMSVADPFLGDHYDRAYGRVRADRRRRRRIGAGRWLLAVPVVALAAGADLVLAPPVLLTALASGLVAVGFWWLSGRGTDRAYWPAAGALLAVLGLTPLVGLVDPGRSGLVVALLAAGAVEVVCGVLDHRTLIRALRRTRVAAGA